MRAVALLFFLSGCWIPFPEDDDLDCYDLPQLTLRDPLTGACVEVGSTCTAVACSCAAQQLERCAAVASVGDLAGAAGGR